MLFLLTWKTFLNIRNSRSALIRTKSSDHFKCISFKIKVKRDCSIMLKGTELKLSLNFAFPRIKSCIKSETWSLNQQIIILMSVSHSMKTSSLLFQTRNSHFQKKKRFWIPGSIDDDLFYISTLTIHNFDLK